MAFITPTFSNQRPQARIRSVLVDEGCGVYPAVEERGAGQLGECSLLLRYSGPVDHLRVLVDLRPDISAEAFGGTAHGLQAVAEKPLPQRRGLDDPFHLGVPARDDVR